MFCCAAVTKFCTHKVWVKLVLKLRGMEWALVNRVAPVVSAPVVTEGVADADSGVDDRKKSTESDTTNQWMDEKSRDFVYRYHRYVSYDQK